MVSNAIESAFFAAMTRRNEVFDECSMIASKCAEIYGIFSERHAQFPDLAPIWRKAYNEATERAEQFKMLSQLKETSFPSLDDQVGDTHSVNHQLGSIIRTLKRTPVLPVPGLQFAIRLGTYVSGFLSQSVSVCKDAELSKLLSEMLETGMEHIQMFERTLNEWMPGEEALAKIGAGIDDLFSNMQKYSFRQVDILNVAVKFEGRLAQYLEASKATGRTELRDLLDCLVARNEESISLIKSALDNLVAKEKPFSTQEEP